MFCRRLYVTEQRSWFIGSFVLASQMAVITVVLITGRTLTGPFLFPYDVGNLRRHELAVPSISQTVWLQHL